MIMILRVYFNQPQDYHLKLFHDVLIPAFVAHRFYMLFNCKKKSSYLFPHTNIPRAAIFEEDWIKSDFQDHQQQST